jgi:formate dehydrogenase subunit gamma
VSQLLPGYIVAAALEFHGYEATLAILVIVVWHFYDVIFRVGVFPADTSIFTGRISRERMKAEHYLEYLELTGPEKDG